MVYAIKFEFLLLEHIAVVDFSFLLVVGGTLVVPHTVVVATLAGSCFEVGSIGCHCFVSADDTVIARRSILICILCRREFLDFIERLWCCLVQYAL